MAPPPLPLHGPPSAPSSPPSSSSLRAVESGITDANDHSETHQDEKTTTAETATTGPNNNNNNHHQTPGRPEAASTAPWPCQSKCIHRCTFAALSHLTEPQLAGGGGGGGGSRDPLSSSSSTCTTKPQPHRHCCYPTEHNGADNDSPRYHVALFPLGVQGALFPGDVIHFRVSVVSALHLYADVSNGCIPVVHQSTVPHDQLLKRTVALASSPNARYGTLAEFCPSSMRQDAGQSYLMQLLILGRYRRLAPPMYHRPYPCLWVSLVCDVALTSPLVFRSLACKFPLVKNKVVISSSSSLPHTHPSHQTTTITCKSSLKRRPVDQRVDGTSNSRGDKNNHNHSAWPKPRSHEDLMVPASWRIPRSAMVLLHEPTLIRRAYDAAISLSSVHPTLIDPSCLENPPSLSACATLWSFWLGSALPHHISTHFFCSLLGESCPLVRLIRLIRLFRDLLANRNDGKRHFAWDDDDDQHEERPRKRRRICASHSDFPVIFPTNTTRTPPNTTKNQNELPSSQLNDDRVKDDVIDGRDEAKCETIAKSVTKRPTKRQEIDGWPCSATNGFKRVNLNYPCRGYFGLAKVAFK